MKGACSSCSSDSLLWQASEAAAKNAMVRDWMQCNSQKIMLDNIADLDSGSARRERGFGDVLMEEGS